MLNKDVINKISKQVKTVDGKLNIGVLLSGKGSNLQALIDHERSGNAKFKIATVISNNPDFTALDRAKNAQIEGYYIDHSQFTNRSDFEKIIIERLNETKVQLVVLAGFLRILSPTFLSAFNNRIINLHPSLLPDFPGLNAIKKAINAKVKEIGCTVHLVDEGLDTGAIIGQSSFLLNPEESLTIVKNKIHDLEHKLLPKIIDEIANAAA